VTTSIDDEEWRGGYYELAMRLGASDDARLDAAVNALARAAGIRDAMSARSLVAHSFQRTRIVLPVDTKRPPSAPADAACVIHLVRDEGADAEDWLDLCLPMGGLARVEVRVGAYPVGDIEGSLAWRRPIDDWFATIGRAVFDAAPFRYAHIGHEVSGYELLGAALVPDGSGLRYEPATR
jgi:hypothetical protein